MAGILLVALAAGVVVILLEVSSSDPEPVSSTVTPPAPEDYRAERRELVERLEEIGISDERVLEAIAKVPRHEFVPEENRKRSYEDEPLPLPEGQTISRPSDVALMLELLELGGDERVLEVGTGSGYQAAVLGCLAAEVYSIEILPSLKETAESNLEEIRRRGILTCERLEILEGDGSRGYPPAAPYDGIIVTAASSELRDDLIEQLRPGGRLVIPVGKRVQELKLVHKKEDGSVERRCIKNVRYAPLKE